MTLRAIRPEVPDLFPEGAQPERLAGGFLGNEGPTYVPSRRAVVFSDVHANRTWRWTDGDTLEPEMEPSHFQNGHTLDAQGRLVACSQGLRALVRQEADGSWTTLADRWAGGRLNSPNDVALHPDGSLWFSDPTYGLDKPEEGYGGVMEQAGRYVFRVAPDGTLSCPIRDRVKPNGLAFADAETLLLGDTGDSQVHVYRVTPQGEATWQRVFSSVTPGKTDGLRLDEHGRVWVTAGDGVHVLTPEGEELGRIPTPGRCSNLCFGGPDGTTLYMTAITELWRVRTRVRGLAW